MSKAPSSSLGVFPFQPHSPLSSTPAPPDMGWASLGVWWGQWRWKETGGFYSLLMDKMCELREKEKPGRPPWFLASAAGSWVVSLLQGGWGEECRWYRVGDGFGESHFICIKLETSARNMQERCQAENWIAEIHSQRRGRQGDIHLRDVSRQMVFKIIGLHLK